MDEGQPASPVMTAATRGAEQRLAFVDGLRAVAALWVVFFHAFKGALLTHLSPALPELVVTLLFASGDLGVSIFFALSGFVMTHTVGRTLVDSSVMSRFMLRRLVRLTPPYYASIVIALVMLAVTIALKKTSAEWPSGAAIAAHLVYMQSAFDIAPLNVVYWTLALEIQFYAAFAVLLLLIPRLRPARADLVHVRVVWFAVTALLSLLCAHGVIPAPSWFEGFAKFWFCFASGCLAWWGWKGGTFAACVAWVGSTLLTVYGLVNDGDFSRTALVVALTSFALTQAGRLARMSRWLSVRPAQFVGNVSYGLYLVHPLVIVIGFAIVRRLVPPGVAADILGLALSLAICLGVAKLMHAFIEVPSQRWSRMIPLHARMQRLPSQGLSS